MADVDPLAADPLATDPLAADCSRCVGLCCVALPFGAGADFAIDKGASEPCPNLAADHRCTIHDRLGTSGFSACVAYDCFGAGQHVTQVTFGGDDWRRHAAVAEPMFAAFRVARPLHEVRWYLREARGLAAAAEVHDELDRADLVGADLAGRDLRAADLRGALLVGADLSGADLRSACFLGADLRGARLHGADLRGALFLTPPQLAATHGDPDR